MGMYSRVSPVACSQQGRSDRYLARGAKRVSRKWGSEVDRKAEALPMTALELELTGESANASGQDLVVGSCLTKGRRDGTLADASTIRSNIKFESKSRGRARCIPLSTPRSRSRSRRKDLLVNMPAHHLQGSPRPAVIGGDHVATTLRTSIMTNREPDSGSDLPSARPSSDSNVDWSIQPARQSARTKSAASMSRR